MTPLSASKPYGVLNQKLPEGNELDILITLVKAYEDENHPVPPPSPIEAIKFVMDQRGFKQADLIPFIGSRP